MLSIIQFMGRRVSRSFAGQFPIFFGLCWSVLISLKFYWRAFVVLAPVAQRLDNAIHRINRYPAVSVDKTNHAIHWIVIYPVDSVIHFLNNRDQIFKCYDNPDGGWGGGVEGVVVSVDEMCCWSATLESINSLYRLSISTNREPGHLKLITLRLVFTLT